jgi:hypothetical protein
MGLRSRRRVCRRRQIGAKRRLPEGCENNGGKHASQPKPMMFHVNLS